MFAITHARLLALTCGLLCLASLASGEAQAGSGAPAAARAVHMARTAWASHQVKKLFAGKKRYGGSLAYVTSLTPSGKQARVIYSVENRARKRVTKYYRALIDVSSNKVSHPEEVTAPQERADIAQQLNRVELGLRSYRQTLDLFAERQVARRGGGVEYFNGAPHPHRFKALADVDVEVIYEGKTPKPKSWLGSDPYEIRAAVYDPNRGGSSDKLFLATITPKQEWLNNPDPQGPGRWYYDQKQPESDVRRRSWNGDKQMFNSKGNFKALTLEPKRHDAFPGAEGLAIY